MVISTNHERMPLTSGTSANKRQFFLSLLFQFYCALMVEGDAYYSVNTFRIIAQTVLRVRVSHLKSNAKPNRYQVIRKLNVLVYDTLQTLFDVPLTRPFNRFHLTQLTMTTYVDYYVRNYLTLKRLTKFANPPKYIVVSVLLRKRSDQIYGNVTYDKSVQQYCIIFEPTATTKNHRVGPRYN